MKTVLFALILCAGPALAVPAIDPVASYDGCVTISSIAQRAPAWKNHAACRAAALKNVSAQNHLNVHATISKMYDRLARVQK